jgi:diaminopimelate epimerase
MSRPFLKMNGLGNDFVVVDARERPFRPSAEEVRRWADRERGIGFDQLIALEPSASGDAFMRVWNADGGEVETCGNALRCVGKLLIEEGRKVAVVDTAAGPTRAAASPDGRIGVDMGRPRLLWHEIPLAEEMDTRRIELQVGPIDAPLVHTPGAVGMGNPHVVFFVGDVEAMDVRGIGSLVERHPLFPEGVNVGFAEIRGRDRIRLRVWERGAGLTRACGTGACAALVAAHRRGFVDRKATLELDGGPLRVQWRDDDHVVMSGPAVLDGEGVLPG